MTSRRSATPSEGEVYSSDSEKAHKSLPTRNSTNVDRRIRDYVSKSRSRSRSPYRSSRGEKRRHDHSRDRERSDPRRFRVRYEDGYNSNRRHRDGSYEDPDPGHTPRSYLRYDEDDRPSHHKRQRTGSRSRSPFRHGRREESWRQHRKDGYLGSGRDVRDSADGSRSHREQSVSERGQSPSVAPVRESHTETRNSQASSGNTTDDPSGLNKRYGYNFWSLI